MEPLPQPTDRRNTEGWYPVSDDFPIVMVWPLLSWIIQTFSVTLCARRKVSK